MSLAISHNEQLARKISRAKWDPKAGLTSHEIPADAVTADLRTQDNALSFWACGSGDTRELDEVVLALAASAERVDKIDLTWISVKELDDAGIEILSTTGLTPVAHLRQRHFDAAALDLSRLVNIAKLVAAAVRTGRHRRIAVSEVKELLRRAIRDKVLSADELLPKVRVSISEAS